MDDDRRFGAQEQCPHRQTTRREALAGGALLGGALLLGDPSASAANDKARRRKRRQRGAAGAGVRPRPFKLLLHNRGVNPVTLSYGDFGCCNVLLQDIVVPAGELQVVSSGRNNFFFTAAFLWINERYWLHFDNYPAHRPDVSAAIGGEPAGSKFCCLPPPHPPAVVNDAKLDVGKGVPITMEGHEFLIVRRHDTNYIMVSVYLPTTL